MNHPFDYPQWIYYVWHEKNIYLTPDWELNLYYSDGQWKLRKFKLKPYAISSIAPMEEINFPLYKENDREKARMFALMLI